MSPTLRADRALFQRGLAHSRTHAARIIVEGRAKVSGRVIKKPSDPVSHADALEVTGAPVGGEWASRAAHKLLGALDTLSSPVELAGARILDVGSSSGGFTDVCLRRGASAVLAVDVGHGQLIERLRRDPRVKVMEGRDARALTRADVGEINGIVSDVSFISLTHIAPPLAAIVDEGTWALFMVKPQFEVGRRTLPKSGVVSDPNQWEAALTSVVSRAAGAGWRLLDVHASTLTGQDGNVEFFCLMRREADSHISEDEQTRMIRAGVSEGVRVRQSRGKGAP